MGKFNRDIIQLIYKFVNNQCSEEEWERVIDILENKKYTKEWEYVMEDRWRNPQYINGIKDEYLKSRSEELIISSGRNSDLKSGNRNGYRRLVMMAASVLVIISFGWLYFFNHTDEVENTIVNTDVRIKRVSMKDGSTVWLNRNSQISYANNFGDSVRLVELKGHGFFDVVRDTSKSFIVNTTNLRIQVLGTSFDVFSYGDDSGEKVLVTSGEVKVNSVLSAEEFLLLPGDELLYNKGEFKVNKKEQFIAEVDEWRSEALSFEDETLGTIIRELEKVYNLNIEFEDSELSNRRITFKPQNAEWSSISAVLELIAKVEINRDTNDSKSYKIRTNE